MRKVLFSLLFAFMSLATMKAWAVNAPTGIDGHSLATLDFVGCQTASIDSSTGTSLVVINATGTTGISTGRAIVYGVITSSVAQSDYLVLKDTTGANGVSGAIASQNALQGVSSTVTVIGNWYQGNMSTANVQMPYPVVNLIKFPVPLQFRNGIVANVSVAPISNGGVSRWTILYRKIDQSER